MEPWEQYQAKPQAAQEPWEQFAAPKTPQPQMPISTGRTILDQAMQGATFGFGDEISDRLGAGIAAISTGEKYADLLKEARDNTKQRLASEIQQNPVTSIAANIGGGLLTGGAALGTKAGTAVANSLGRGGLFTRIGKGAIVGAGSGSLYGAGSADDGNMAEGAKQGAIFGALVGGAVPAVGAAISDIGGTIGSAARGAVSRSPEIVQQTADSMRSAAGDLYKKMRDVGAVLNPSTSNGLLSTIDGEVVKNKFIPALNPKTTAIIDDLRENIVKNNGSIGLDELDQYRRLLGRVGATEDGVSAGAARRAIDDVVNNMTNNSLVNGGEEAVALLNKGRAQYAQASKFDDISDVLNKADGDPNRIKAGLKRFLNNDSNTKGWRDDEIAALKDAASATGTEKILKMFGKFGFDLGTSLTPGNTVAPLVGGALAGGASGGIGAVLVPAAGTAARIGQKMAARGGAENLLRALEGKASTVSVPSISPTITAPVAGNATNLEAQREALLRQAMTLPPAQARKLLQK